MIDNRFGNFKFGTTHKFGYSTTENKISWGIEIDWDGNGVFSGANEAENLCGISIHRGRNKMLKDAGDGLEQIAPGNAVLTFWNNDGRYDGWNSDSPLYPYVGEGKDVRISVRDFETGEIKPVFYGVITNIVPTGYDETPKVNIYIGDGWLFLRNYTANVDIQSSVSPDTAIGLILDAARWPSRWGRNLDAAPSDVIPFWWSSGDKKAGAECEDVANAFFWKFLHRCQGTGAICDTIHGIHFYSGLYPEPGTKGYREPTAVGE